MSLCKMSGDVAVVPVFWMNDTHSGILSNITANGTTVTTNITTPDTGSCAAAAKLFFDKDQHGADPTGTSYFSVDTWEECCEFCATTSTCWSW